MRNDQNFQLTELFLMRVFFLLRSVQTIAFNLPNDERVRKEKGAKKVKGGHKC